MEKINVDTLVVGAGLAGVFAAALYGQMGKKVLLVEALSKAGGRWSPEKRDGFQLGSGIGLFNGEVWKEVYGAAGLSYNEVLIPNGKCMTYQSKKWRPASNLPPWESYFAQTAFAMPQGGVAGFIHDALSRENFEIRYECPITSVVVESKQVLSVQAGTHLEIACKECLWAGGPSSLQKALMGEELPKGGAPRNTWLKKLFPHPPCPGIVLEFAHSSRISDFTETIALPLSGENYLMGIFTSNRDHTLAPNGKQISTWIFSLSEKQAESNHEIMKKIRESRRLLERSFVGFESSVLFDRVQALEHTTSPNTKKKRATPFNNFYFISDLAAPTGAHFEGTVQGILDLMGPSSPPACSS